MQKHESLAPADQLRPLHRNESTHLKTVTPIRLAIDHIQHLLLNLPTHRIPHRPVIPRAGTSLVHIEILGVIDVLVRASLDTVDHPGLEIQENRAGDVSRVVGLVEEDVLAVAAVRCEVLQIAILVDAVLKAKLLPKL